MSGPRTGDFARVDASDQISDCPATSSAPPRHWLTPSAEASPPWSCGPAIARSTSAAAPARTQRSSPSTSVHAARCSAWTTAATSSARPTRHSHLPNIRFVTGDAHRLPYETGTLSAARVERVLMHVADPAQVIAEMARVVAPGGRIAAFEPDWDTLIIDADPLAHTRAVTRRWSDHVRHGTIGRQLSRLLAATGLTAIELTPVPTVLRDLPTAAALLELNTPAAATLEPLGADAWLNGLRERRRRALPRHRNVLPRRRPQPGAQG